MTDRDIKHEKAAIRESEDIPDQRIFNFNVGKEINAGHGECQAHKIAGSPEPANGQKNRAEKFNGADCAQREHRDREIKAAIHYAKHKAKGDEAALIAAVQSEENTPRFSEKRENYGCCSDAQRSNTQGCNLLE